MSFFTHPDLRQSLVQAVRSNGHNGLTTAQELRDFLGFVLDELETAEATQAAAGSHLAEAITSGYVRTGYAEAQAALNGAGDHGTATVYSLAYGAIATNDATTTVPGLVFPNTILITNLQGLSLYTPDANTDVLTFTGGTQVVNANHSTIITHPVVHQKGLGWTITAHSNVVQDVTIHDLHLIVQGIRTHGIYLTDPGRYQFSGSLTMGRVATSATQNSYYRWGIYNRQGTFVGRGTLTAYGTDASTVGPGLNGVDQRLFEVGSAATTTWEGSIQVYDDVSISLGTSATLTLREGVLNAQARTTGARPLFSSDGGTVVLENYAFLCRPGEEAIRADTVILRGSSVVVGTLSAAHIIDERPAVLSPAGVVHLDGAETITGPKTFANPVYAPAFVGDGSQLTLPTGPRCNAHGPGLGPLTGSTNPVILHFHTATGSYDVATGHFAPGKAGIYAITMGGLLHGTSVGGEMYLGLLINGSRFVMVQHWSFAVADANGGGTGYVEIELGPSDYVEALIYNDNGGQPYTVFETYYHTFFTARWLSA